MGQKVVDKTIAGSYNIAPVYVVYIQPLMPVNGLPDLSGPTIE